MWTTIFALTFATAIIFSVASYMLLHTRTYLKIADCCRSDINVE
jgi:hypothetical protein